MLRYRTLLSRAFTLIGIAAVATMTLSTLIGAWWQFRAVLAATDFDENVAAMQRNVSASARYLTGQSGSTTFADFAGQWGRHGFMLLVQPDGRAEAVWRTYDDSPSAPAGYARLVFSTVENRTAFGSIVDSSGSSLPIGPMALTIGPDGIAFLVAGDRLQMPSALRRPADGITLCRPETWHYERCGA